MNPAQTRSMPSPRASSSRSFEMSKLAAAARWTPPGRRWRPRRCACARATQRVAETVVAASRPHAVATARSRRLALRNRPDSGPRTDRAMA